MKTLRVYGDSYAASDKNCLFSWANQLGKRFNIPIVNKAIVASSTEYSMINFTEDVTNNIIGDNDIVCFVTSTPGRLTLRYISEERPNWAGKSAPWKTLPKNLSNAWYWDNKDHIEWYRDNQDYKLLKINHESYIHTIKDYAWSKPNATFVLLQNLDHNIPISIPGGPVPKNFLMPDIFLGQLNRNEVIDWKSWEDFLEYNYDNRPNHLCIPNLNVLVDLLVYSIQNLTVDNFDYKYFHKQIISKITNAKQHSEYVKLGLLPNLDNEL
jgi:hypothetical protein